MKLGNCLRGLGLRLLVEAEGADSERAPTQQENQCCILSHQYQQYVI
jgi:hypothetical protein